MKQLLSLLFAIATIAANGQRELQFQLDIHLDATFDKEATEEIKNQGNPAVEFIGPNNFKIETESLDSVTLEKKLNDIFKERQQTKTLVIVDAKGRTFKEYTLIVKQLHRTLLRIKDTFSVEQLGVKYKEIKNQQDIDSIDKVIPFHTITVDRTLWR
jgi:hypothetical protein